ncbi:unnamed protein product [Rotaria sp. Silwood1]|nr:unnamed protein product [Rotaria sp. Silwood1]
MGLLLVVVRILIVVRGLLVVIKRPFVIVVRLLVIVMSLLVVTVGVGADIGVLSVGIIDVAIVLIACVVDAVVFVVIVVVVFWDTITIPFSLRLCNPIPKPKPSAKPMKIRETTIPTPITSPNGSHGLHVFLPRPDLYCFIS